MSQIEKLYEAYCMGQDSTPMAPERLWCYEVLSNMLPHKDYMEIEALLNSSSDQRDKEYFFAGFRAATRIWTEALK